MASGLSTQINGKMGQWGTLPDFRTFPPDDLLGLFTCQRGYLQGYKTSKIASVAICGRSCHIMPVLEGLIVFSQQCPFKCSRICISELNLFTIGPAVWHLSNFFLICDTLTPARCPLGLEGLIVLAYVDSLVNLYVRQIWSRSFQWFGSVPIFMK